MADEVYTKLRDKLDTIGFGYSPTETGVEFVFLERFFKPEEAACFVDMPIDAYVTPEEMAAIRGTDVEETAELLKSMAKRGLIFRTYDSDGNPKYRCVPVAHGIFEFHVDQVEHEWSNAFSQHYMQGWGQKFYGNDTPIFRIIPASKDIVSTGEVEPFDDIDLILRDKKKYAVSQCICRLRSQERGEPCKHEIENCLMFDDFADYYLENGLAREITLEETQDIIKRGVKSGLVIQVANAEEVEAVCLCCSCACGLLGALKYFPGPGNQHVSNFYCVRDESACLDNCKHVCATRCPVGAFKSKDGVLTFKQEKCIGCGLCVSTCPGQALTLVPKAQANVYEPQGETLFDTYEIISKERGVL